MTRLAVVLALTLAGFASAMGAALAAQTTFIIFFHEGDREKLDPKQWEVIPAGVDVALEAATVHQQMGGAVLLIGNDQNVGSAADALTRSRRRAEAVRDLLARFGVKAEVIRIKACGSSNPLAGNAKGVSEPQNRYVTIDLLPSASEVLAGANAVCPSAARDGMN